MIVGSRIISAILGYILPFVLLFTLLFMLEWLIELTIGLFAAILNNTLNSGFDETPNFYGPTDVLNAAIGFFPSIWDLGTGIFYGGLGAGTYLFYIMIAILDGLVAHAIFKNLKDNFFTISKDAIARSAARFGSLSSDSDSFTTSSDGVSQDTVDTYEYISESGEAYDPNADLKPSGDG